MDPSHRIPLKNLILSSLTWGHVMEAEMEHPGDLQGKIWQNAKTIITHASDCASRPTEPSKISRKLL